MHDTPSNMPSSMLISKTWAPFSTCSLATASASCVLQKNKDLKKIHNYYIREWQNFQCLKKFKSKRWSPCLIDINQFPYLKFPFLNKPAKSPGPSNIATLPNVHKQGVWCNSHGFKTYILNATKGNFIYSEKMKLNSCKKGNSLLLEKEHIPERFMALAYWSFGNGLGLKGLTASAIALNQNKIKILVKSC